VPFIESINKFQNPFRRPIAMTFFLVGTFAAIWLGIGATLPIDISLTLGLFLTWTILTLKKLEKNKIRIKKLFAIIICNKTFVLF
jgi:hypothetical protein